VTSPAGDRARAIFDAAVELPESDRETYLVGWESIVSQQETWL
jgi:hypothetical protein